MKKKQNKKQTKTNKTKTIHKITYLLATIAIILSILFLSRGWIRMTVYPWMVSLSSDQAKSAGQAELASLQDPFNLSQHKEADAINGCETIMAKRFKTLISCQYTASRNIELNNDNKAESVQIAKNTQELLQANGWQGQFEESSDYTSLTSLTAAVADNIDYTPDATYSKTIGDVECIFQGTTAFSKPAKPLMSLRMMCTDEVSLFGEIELN